MKVLWLLVIGVLPAVSCAGQTAIKNKYHNKLTFSAIKSNFELTDSNKYGCERIDASVIKHVLETGTLISRREVHDHYSTTGCSVKGSMLVNGRETDFTFEYGGIIYFKNDMILGCGQNCCSDKFAYCSWEPGPQP